MLIEIVVLQDCCVAEELALLCAWLEGSRSQPRAVAPSSRQRSGVKSDEFRIAPMKAEEIVVWWLVH